jgi:hypothetical protein
MSEYDTQANKFLQNFNLQITMEEGENKKECDWNCGNSYLVTIKKGKKKMSFDFHDSRHNQDTGMIPSNYSILACIASESYCPDTLEEFLMEYGYEEKEGRKVFKNLKSFSEKINKFFTEEEMESLREIQ